MSDFKKEALEWAQKTLKEQGIEEQLNRDFINHFVLGMPIGYRIDKDGNFSRLTQEELWDLKSRSKKWK